MIDLFDNSFTIAEFIELISVAVPLIVIYFVTGFGPGLILGILIINRIFGRGNPIYMEVHQENIKKATAHNAQWSPTHERWQK